MRKFFVVLLSIMLLLSGCSLSLEGPELLQIDGKSYKTGFYGTLYPNEYPLNMVYQYDYGHGEYEKLIAVKVPEDISTYFVTFMEVFLEQKQLQTAQSR